MHRRDWLKAGLPLLGAAAAGGPLQAAQAPRENCSSPPLTATRFSSWRLMTCLRAWLSRA